MLLRVFSFLSSACCHPCELAVIRTLQSLEKVLAEQRSALTESLSKEAQIRVPIAVQQK